MSYWSLTTAPTVDHCIIGYSTTIYLTNLSVCSPRLPAKTIMVFVRSTSASPATTELSLVASGVACNRPYHAHWRTRPMKGGTYSGDEKTIGTNYTTTTLVNSKLNFAIPRKTSGVFHKKTVWTPPPPPPSMKLTPYLRYFYNRSIELFRSLSRQ